MWEKMKSDLWEFRDLSVVKIMREAGIDLRSPKVKSNLLNVTVKVMYSTCKLAVIQII